MQDSTEPPEPAAASPLVDVLVLCGPDDGLRARAALALAAQRPPGERWAVVRSGVVAGPAAAAATALPLYDAGAGCGCCVGQTALRLTLARALREGRRVGGWQGLLLDLGAATRPRALETLLRSPPFAGLLRPPGRIVVVDPATLGPPGDRPGGPGEPSGERPDARPDEQPDARLGERLGERPGPAMGSARARLLEQLAWCDTLMVPPAMPPTAQADAALARLRSMAPHAGLAWISPAAASHP